MIGSGTTANVTANQYSKYHRTACNLLTDFEGKDEVPTVRVECQSCKETRTPGEIRNCVVVFEDQTWTRTLLFLSICLRLTDAAMGQVFAQVVEPAYGPEKKHT